MWQAPEGMMKDRSLWFLGRNNIEAPGVLLKSVIIVCDGTHG